MLNDIINKSNSAQLSLLHLKQSIQLCHIIDFLYVQLQTVRSKLQFFNLYKKHRSEVVLKTENLSRKNSCS